MNTKRLPNGATVIVIDYDREVVLANFGTDNKPNYVTWAFNKEQGLRSTCWGRYFSDDLKAARTDFTERQQRGY
jgi:hypothetical protein